MLEPFVEKALEKLKDASLAPVYLEQISLLEKHITFLNDKLSHAEKENIKLESKLEIIEKELEETRTKLESLEPTSKIIDIGPCLIKETSTGIRLNGFYCLKCRAFLKKGQYDMHSEDWSYMCTECHRQIPAEDVESAFAGFQD